MDAKPRFDFPVAISSLLGDVGSDGQLPRGIPVPRRTAPKKHLLTLPDKAFKAEYSQACRAGCGVNGEAWIDKEVPAKAS
jgi:hypothetical protein